MCSLAAPPGPGTLPPLRQHGRWLVDPAGRVVTVHGFNVVAKLPPYTPRSFGFGADDAAFLAAHGYNAVRLGFMWKALEPVPGHYNDHYLDQVATTVATLARHGIYTLLDFHEDFYHERFGGQGFPDWAVFTGGRPNLQWLSIANPAEAAAWDHFWANRPVGGVGLRERFAAMWRHVARRFAGDGAVLGYDLVNEPQPGSDLVDCVFGDCAVRGAMEATYRAAAAAIREVDAEHVVWWEHGIGNLAQPSPELASSGLSYHDYCPLSAALPGELAWLRDLVCPWPERLSLDDAVSDARAADAIPLLTEFGSTRHVAELRRVAGDADDHMMGWLEWTYYSNGTSDFAGTPSLVRDPRKPPTGSNVSAALLRALTRPYPRAVAGTPKAWSFDSESGRFALRYGTGGVAGALGARDTTVSVPAVAYPDGYAVTLSGASVASAAGYEVLRVEADAGTDEVSVEITPT
jgi:endoglycosylceramidase